MEILKEFSKFGFSDDYKKESWCRVKEIIPLFKFNVNYVFCLKGNKKIPHKVLFCLTSKLFKLQLHLKSVIKIFSELYHVCVIKSLKKEK